MTDKPPLKLWQGIIVTLVVALLVLLAYFFYHAFWGRLSMDAYLLRG